MKNRYVKVFSLLFVAFVAFSGTLAQAEIKLQDKIPLSPRLIKGTLPNGLTYYIQKNVKPANKAEMRLVVRAGSILEDDDQQGLAHFTEHMAFNGSTHFKKQELISFLQSIGVKFGADLNAYTSFDETVYILPIPTDKPGNLAKGMDVLEDWAGGLTFDPVEIDRERGVVLEESRLGKGANDRMNKILLPKIFEGTKYADRLPIGKDEIIGGFKHEVVKRFYADWYRPDLMAVIVVGDVDPKTVEQMIKSRFSKLKNPAHERPRVYSSLPARTSEAAVVATDKEMSNNVLSITFSQARDPGEFVVADYRKNLVRNLFNALLSQRLQELTQTANPPFVTGNSGVGAFVRHYTQFSSYAVLGKGGVEPAVNALIAENARAARFGFTPAELERVKKNFLRGLERSYEERDKTESARFASEFIRNFLIDESIPGIEREFDYAKQFLPTVSLDEVNRFARDTIMTGSKKLVLYRGVEQAGVSAPSVPALLAAVADAEKKEVSAYQEKVLAASLMAKTPVAGKIVAEKKDAALGVTELTLSNGVTVFLKPSDFKNDEVVMRSVRKGGTSLFPDQDFYSAQYAANLMRSMGLGSFSPVEVGKMLSGKNVNVAPYLSELREGLNGASGSAEIETMLQMTHLYFTQPRKDAVLFQSAIGKQQDSLKNLMARPDVVFQDAVWKKMYANQLRGPRVPTPVDFDKVDLERVTAIYHERFASARGYTFFFVGSFDVEKIKPLIATYLASLPGAEIVANFKDVSARPVKGVIKFDERVGMDQKSLISMTFTGSATSTAQTRMQLAALLDVLNIKFNERFREAMGVVYGSHAGGSINKDPYGHYSITLNIPCGPENVDKLIAAALDEINKLKENGPQEADLNKVKENWYKSYREAVKTNNYWASSLTGAYENGEDPAQILNYEARVAALQAADIKTAARTYFNMDNYLQAVMYPADKTVAK